ncbi:MAG: ABC transporter permease [Christensenellales bacterium]
MLYKKYVDMHLKSSFEYRLNTLMIAFSQVIISIGELLAVYLLFLQFNSVGSWGFYEAALMFGVITTVFSLAECFGRGYDEFPKLIKKGDLDRMLVRPVNIHLQILGSKIEFVKLSRTVLGIVVSVIAVINMNVSWDVWKVLVLILTFVCGFLVVLGLLMIGAGISVFTVDNLEFINIITNGSKELAFYPIDIYKKWLTRIFTFVIPVACFNYLPLCFLTGKGSLSPIIYGISPVLGMLFFVPCLLFMNFCLKKYQSTGT